MDFLKRSRSVSVRMKEMSPREDGRCPLRRERGSGHVFRDRLWECQQEAWNMGRAGAHGGSGMRGREERRSRRRGMRRTG